MRHSLFLLTFASTAAVINAFTWQQPHGHALFGSWFGMPGIDAEYDYVIAGGGLAGLVVAERLAENRSLSVAVIEAGTFYELSNGNESQIPWYSQSSESADPTAHVNKWIDWDLVTVPQPQLNNRQIHYAQGKCLGGSSARNQMIYQRGTRGSYDLWARMVGDESYNWDCILPFFKRSPQFTPPNMSIRGANATAEYETSAYSSTGGPLHVTYPNYAMPFGSYGISALKAIGFPTGPGLESGILHGVTRNPFTIDPVHQMRSSSEATFLDHAITTGLPMTVYPMTQAMRIVFDQQKRATGVEVQSAGMNWTVSTRKEVIVSAGVYHSPQLLMVSGVGPAETLDAHNITVVKDLPGVGQNMHDSCNIGGVTHNSSIKTPAITTAVIEQYINNASGILTNSGGDVLGFEKLPAHLRNNMSNATLEQLARWPADWPEVEYIRTTAGGPTGATSAVVSMLMTAAISRGNVTIRSDSMLDKPVISTNWLLEKADQEVAVQAYRRARDVWQNIPNGIKTSEEIFPGTNVTTNEQLLEAIRGEVGAIHHGTSTCMMGHANDTMAVVDSHARVFGVERLRVIHSSSFLFTPPGHTQAATYAHAEKLVEGIMQSL